MVGVGEFLQAHLEIIAGDSKTTQTPVPGVGKLTGEHPKHHQARGEVGRESIDRQEMNLPAQGDSERQRQRADKSIQKSIAQAHQKRGHRGPGKWAFQEEGIIGMKSVPEKNDTPGQNRRFDHRQPSGRWARILRLRSRGEEPRMNHGWSSASSESMSL